MFEWVAYMSGEEQVSKLSHNTHVLPQTLDMSLLTG